MLSPAALRFNPSAQFKLAHRKPSAIGWDRRFLVYILCCAGFLVILLRGFRLPNYTLPRPISPPPKAHHHVGHLQKPEGVNVSAMIFYGRRDRVAALRCYLDRNLVENGGWLDEVLWLANTSDEENLAYLEEIIASNPSHKKIVMPDNEILGYTTWYKAYQLLERGRYYIKIDDDILWMDDSAIENLVKAKMSRPDDLVVSGNVINNPPLAFMHYHMGAMHPYFPEYIEPTEEEKEEAIRKAKEKEEKKAKEKEEEEGKENEEEEEEEEEAEENDEEDRDITDEDEQEINNGDREEKEEEQEELRDTQGQDDENSSTSQPLTRRQSTSWRPSEDPYWSGPDGYSWSLENEPPRDPHRWLRLDNDGMLDRTPASKLTYEVWGDSYESWAIATQMHYSLLENIEEETLDLYKFGTWTMGGERIRINFMCIFADQVLETMDDEDWTRFGDEDMLTILLPRKLHTPVSVEGSALAAHFQYGHQHGLEKTDLLSRYTNLAHEKYCPRAQPPPSHSLNARSRLQSGGSM